MTAHDHDPEYYNRNKKNEVSHPKKDKGVEHDLLMLDRLSSYTLSARDKEMIVHLLEKANPDTKLKFLFSFIESRIGSAILDYDTRFCS